jgi:hypothetical protein
MLGWSALRPLLKKTMQNRKTYGTRRLKKALPHFRDFSLPKSLIFRYQWFYLEKIF